MGVFSKYIATAEQMSDEELAKKINSNKFSRQNNNGKNQYFRMEDGILWEEAIRRVMQGSVRVPHTEGFDLSWGGQKFEVKRTHDREHNPYGNITIQRWKFSEWMDLDGYYLHIYTATNTVLLFDAQQLYNFLEEHIPECYQGKENWDMLPKDMFMHRFPRPDAFYWHRSNPAKGTVSVCAHINVLGEDFLKVGGYLPHESNTLTKELRRFLKEKNEEES
jgi:hypothetical protein